MFSRSTSKVKANSADLKAPFSACESGSCEVLQLQLDSTQVQCVNIGLLAHSSPSLNAPGVAAPARQGWKTTIKTSPPSLTTNTASSMDARTHAHAAALAGGLVNSDSAISVKVTSRLRLRLRLLRTDGQREISDDDDKEEEDLLARQILHFPPQPGPGHVDGETHIGVGGGRKEGAVDNGPEGREKERKIFFCRLLRMFSSFASSSTSASVSVSVSQV